MKHQAHTLKPALLKSAMMGLGLLSLAACNHTDVAAPTPIETTMRNSVQMVRLPYEVKAEDDGTDTPSATTVTALDGFLNGVKAGYGDVVLLDGDNVSAARIAAVGQLIRERGLAFGGVATLGGRPADGSIMVYVERYRVTTPNCGDWAAETSNNQRNNPSSFFGCSNTVNLGLMVANPRDLIAGQEGTGMTSVATDILITYQKDGKKVAETKRAAEKKK